MQMNGTLTPTLPPGLGCGVLTTCPLLILLGAQHWGAASRGQAYCWLHAPLVPGTLPGGAPGCLSHAHTADTGKNPPFSVVDEGAAALSQLLLSH